MAERTKTHHRGAENTEKKEPGWTRRKDGAAKKGPLARGSGEWSHRSGERCHQDQDKDRLGEPIYPKAQEIAGQSG